MLFDVLDGVSVSVGLLELEVLLEDALHLLGGEVERGSPLKDRADKLGALSVGSLHVDVHSPEIVPLGVVAEDAFHQRPANLNVSGLVLHRSKLGHELDVC